MLDHAITRFKDFLWRLPWGVFLLILLAFLVLKNGLWVAPGIETIRAISLDLHHNPVAHEPRAQFLMYSYFGPLLAHLLHANGTTQQFVLMHFLFWLVGTVAILYRVREKFGDDLGRLAGLALVGLPVTTTCLVWLGKSDGFVFVCSSLLFLTASSPVAFVAGIILGLANFEQGVFIVLFLLIPACLIKRPAVLSVRLLLFGLAGLAVGEGLMLGWFHYNHFDLNSGRLYYMLSEGAGGFAHQLAFHFGVLALSLFGAFWPYLIFRLEAARETDRQLFTGAAIGLAGAAALLCVVMDSTRVFALLTWPIFLLLLPGLLDEGARRAELKKIFLACALAAVVFPPLMVAPDRLFSSANYVFGERVITAVETSQPVFPDKNLPDLSSP